MLHHVAGNESASPSQSGCTKYKKVYIKRKKWSAQPRVVWECCVNVEPIGRALGECETMETLTESIHGN